MISPRLLNAQPACSAKIWAEDLTARTGDDRPRLVVEGPEVPRAPVETITGMCLADALCNEGGHDADSQAGSEGTSTALTAITLVTRVMSSSDLDHLGGLCISRKLDRRDD